MQTFILKENVLTDNLLLLAEEGKSFKGGYIAIIKEYTFQNAWSDKLTIKRFRCNKRLGKYIMSTYPSFEYSDYII
jgi:hypothetical protein